MSEYLRARKRNLQFDVLCFFAVAVLACVDELGDARLGREEEDDVVERERGHEVEQEPSLEEVDGDPPRI